ncbi:MAG: sulfur carrier protein ThiS [Desulfobulbaceae bacterium]|nr:sulfur carrier protein ThiS [Desulfobulbaceae bacterium]
MQITVNGENREFDASSLPITTLLEVAKVESPDMVSVQVNGKVIDRTLYADTQLRDNDEVDFLYFMGGGA